MTFKTFNKNVTKGNVTESVDPVRSYRNEEEGEGQPVLARRVVNLNWWHLEFSTGKVCQLISRDYS